MRLNLLSAVSISILPGVAIAASLNGGSAIVPSGGVAEDWNLSNHAELTVEQGGAVLSVDMHNSDLLADGASFNKINIVDSTANIASSEINSSSGPAVQIGANVGNVQPSVVNITDSHLSGSGSGLSVIGDGSVITLDHTSVKGTMPGSGAGSLPSQTGSGIASYGARTRIFNGSTITGAGNGIFVTVDDSVSSSASLEIDNSTVSGLNGSAIRVADYPFGNSSDVTVDIRNGASLSGSDGNILYVADSATTDFNVDNSALFGNLVAEDAATLNVTLVNKAALTGNIQGVSSMAINSESQWNMDGDNAIGTLTLEGGTVNFNSGDTFRTLKADSLSGNGSFLMNTDLAAHTGDMLDIAGKATGIYTLAIKNTGKEPIAGDDSLQIVHTGSGDAQFSLAGDKVDAGAWQYSLSQEGYDWYLTQDSGSPQDRSTTPSTDAILNMASAPVYIFNSELPNLHFRRGDIQDDNATSGGLWGRYLASDNRINGAENSAYSMKQNGMEIGGDTVLDVNHGHLALGAFIAYSDNNISHVRGDNSSVNSTSGGLYATWLDNSGFYVDAVAKYNHFSNRLQTHMSDGTPVNGDYAQDGFGGSLEAGMTFNTTSPLWLQPYLRTTAFQAEGKSVDLDNGMAADISTTRSVQVEAGANVGLNLQVAEVPVKPYLKAALVQEFIDNNKVRINDTYNFHNDISGATGKYGGGVSSQLTLNSSIWVEANYQKGSHIESPITANAGFRINF